MARAVGIDLGTTNSVVAAVDGAGKPVALKGPGQPSPIVPSVVWFDGGRIVVGDEAKGQQAVDDAGVASFFKRQMGDPDARFVVPGGRSYTPVELSAEVLKRLKADAEHALSDEVRDAVITVPAYFYDAERKATEQAAALAGLSVLQLINEPTAAAVAFGASAGDRGDNVLVYDLGGGTFDVTLLKVSGKDIRVATTHGDARLGGKDWDQRIVNFLAGQFRDQFSLDLLEDRTATGDLWVTAEKAKKDLTARASTKIRLTHKGEQLEYELTREFFQTLTADLTQRTIDFLQVVLDRAKVAPTQVELVLLVGGSTRMPMVQEALERYTGRKPSKGVNPDEAVALGAALCAAGHATREQPRFSLSAGEVKQSSHTFTLPSGLAVTDVVSHTLGMIAVSADGTQYVNDAILAKDQPVPRVDRKAYHHRTARKGDNRLEIFLTQGEDVSPANVRYLGCYAVPKVPYDPSGVVTVEVTYVYNRGGSTEVTAAIVGSAQPLTVVVEPVPEDVPERFMRPPEQPKAQPITVYLSFDLSGSMSGSPLADAKRSAIESFVAKLDLSNAAVGVIAHADRAVVKLSASNNDRHVRKAIDSMTIGEVGGGNSQHPFDLAMTELREVEGPRYVVALADGQWGDQNEAIVSAKALHAEGIEVIALGFGGADEDFLRDVASSADASILTSQSGLGAAFSSIASVIGGGGAGGGGGRGPASSPTPPASGGGGLFGGLFRKR